MEKRNRARTRFGTLAPLALLLVLAGVVSCEQKPLEPDPSGMAIRFGAATGYENDRETRTEYSGYDENGNVMGKTSKYERIDWVADHDRVRILCAQAQGAQSGDYLIGAPTSNGKESRADATLVSGGEFYWSRDVQHSFYALYPAPGTTSNYHTGAVSESDSQIELQNEGATALITGSIPAVQPLVAKASGSLEFKPNMNVAYMYAKKRTAKTEGGYVQLEFYPLVTAFEFSLLANDDAMAMYDLVSATLTSGSTDLWGDFTVALDAGSTDAPTVTKTGTYGEDNKTLKVTLPEGTKLSKTVYTKVTFLALGVAQTDLTLKLNFSNHHSRTTILQKKNGTEVTNVSVGACKKVYFQLGVPSEPIYYIVDPMATDPFDGEHAGYQAVTRALDEIDNSSDRGLQRQRFGVFAWRNPEGTVFNAATFNPSAATGNPYLENRDVYLEEARSGNYTFWSNGKTVGTEQVRDLAYWPSYDYLNFFAYAPYMDHVQPYTQGDATVTPPLVFPSADYTAGMPRATYTPSSNVTTQVDLCVSTPRFDRTKDTNPMTNPVPLAFKHALTRVRLYVRAKGTRQPLYEYRVTGVKMSGLVGTNTFTYVNSETTPFQWDAFTASTPRETGYDLTYNDTQLTSEGLKFIGDEVGEGVTDPYTWVNSPFNGRLYLLPQDITSGAGLEIVVSLYKTNGAIWTLQSVLPPFDLHIPVDTDWEPGKTVSYLITVDISKLVVLDITPLVTPWADSGNTHTDQIIF